MDWGGIWRTFIDGYREAFLNGKLCNVYKVRIAWAFGESKNILFFCFCLRIKIILFIPRFSDWNVLSRRICGNVGKYGWLIFWFFYIYFFLHKNDGPVFRWHISGDRNVNKICVTVLAVSFLNRGDILRQIFWYGFFPAFFQKQYLKLFLTKFHPDPEKSWKMMNFFISGHNWKEKNVSQLFAHKI